MTLSWKDARPINTMNTQTDIKFYLNNTDMKYLKPSYRSTWLDIYDQYRNRGYLSYKQIDFLKLAYKMVFEKRSFPVPVRRPIEKVYGTPTEPIQDI